MAGPTTSTHAVDVLHRALFEGAGVAMVVSRPDGLLLDGNRALRTMLGYSRDELLGLRSADLFPAGHPDATELREWRAGEVRHVRHEEGLLRGDGVRISVSVTLRAVQDPAGEGILLLQVVHDDSVRGALGAGRDHAVAALAKTNERLTAFQALVEASNDFIAIADLARRLRYVNPAGRALVGLDPALDITELTIRDCLGPEEGPDALSARYADIIDRPVWSGESTLRDHRGGPAIPVAVARFLMVDPVTGEPFARGTVQRDITARKAAEAELRSQHALRHELLDRLVAAQEAERARIAADVHDDSVQALAVVDLRLGLLERQLGGDRPEHQDLLGQVRTAVREATERLRHLLFDLEPPAAGTSLVDALRDCAAFLFEGTRTRWSLVEAAEVDLPYAERVTAVRIAKEALVNARQHAGAASVTIAVRLLDGGTEIAVTDDGAGIDPETVTSPTGHRGLTTMQDRAAVAGGWCRLERNPTTGSTVRFWLPHRMFGSA